MALAKHGVVPGGAWPVFIGHDLEMGKAGCHSASHGNPFACVDYDTGWQVAVSHEVCEMLVDPTLRDFKLAREIKLEDGVIKDGTKQVEYLIEICDPSEHPDYGYTIENVAVSDFITPAYYDDELTNGTQYSFTKAIVHPRQVRPGGYLSWRDPENGKCHQLDWVRQAEPKMIDLDWVPPEMRLSRHHIDQHMQTTKGLSRVHHQHPLMMKTHHFRH